MESFFGNKDKYYELGSSFFWLGTHHDIVIEFARPLIKTRGKPEGLRILDTGL